MHQFINQFPMGPLFVLFHVFLRPPLSRQVGPLRAEVVVGFRRVRLVQALPSSPSSAGLVPFAVGLRFPFPLPFQGCPLWARFHVLVFSPSLFFCVPLFASWLSNFHLIVIFTSFSFPFLLISSHGRDLKFTPSCGRVCVCVDHLKGCKTSTYRCHFFVFCMVTLQAMKVFCVLQSPIPLSRGPWVLLPSQGQRRPWK